MKIVSYTQFLILGGNFTDLIFTSLSNTFFIIELKHFENRTEVFH